MTLQRFAALGLVGKRVRFHHSPDTYVVLRATADGLVELDSMSGYFSPHLFIVIGDGGDA